MAIRTKKFLGLKLSIPYSVYLCISSTGVILTLFSLLNGPLYTEMSRNLFSVLSNLGTGLLASGILGWLLDSISSRRNNEIVAYKRESLLRDLKTVIQTFLNASCNKFYNVRRHVYDIEDDDRQLPVADIFKVVKQFELKLLAELGNCQIESKENCEYLESLYQRDTNYDQMRSLTCQILNERDLYIVNGIFSEEEIEIFGMINECIVKIQELLEIKEYVSLVAFVDSLYDKVLELIQTIDQFRALLDLKFINYTIRNVS